MTYEELLKEKQEFKERLKHCSNTMIYRDTLKHYEKVCQKLAKFKVFRLWYEEDYIKVFTDRHFESKQQADEYGKKYLTGVYVEYETDRAIEINYLYCEERGKQ